MHPLFEDSRALLTGACLLVALGARAQEGEPPPITYPSVLAQGSSAAAFVPSGWKIEKLLESDFDRDGKSDALLLLRMDDSANVLADPLGDLDTNPRMLLGLLATNGGYRRAFTNHALIPRHETRNVEDPYESLSVEQRGFMLGLRSFANSGSWFESTTTFRFRFEGGCFRLTGYDHKSHHRASDVNETVSINYLTGRFETAEEQLESDKPRRRRGKLRDNPKLCIEQLTDGLAFEPKLPKRAP